jgi:predicted 2-oxoglutarate/Fe(II)-dependent dioxygenase YbiX
MTGITQKVIFTEEECNYMLSLAESWNTHSRYKQPGKSVEESQLRPSKNSTLKKLLIDKLSSGFKVKDILYDELKFIRYTKGVAFGYHVDSVWMQDKNDFPHGTYQTMIIQMTDGSNYKGGDLTLHYKGEKIIANKAIGNVVCYDSDIPHEVTEVTEGTRISGLIVLSIKDFELSLL